MEATERGGKQVGKSAARSFFSNMDESCLLSLRRAVCTGCAEPVDRPRTIPLFFQPVEEGSALLVDGGIVSNIPHFLFTGEAAQNIKGRQRVLLFMLEASEQRKRADDVKELVSQLASLAVDGGTDVQLAFTPDVARIIIPTGSIRATDFNEMDETQVSTLIRNGRSAADTFITRELLNTHGSPAESNAISDEHEAYIEKHNQGSHPMRMEMWPNSQLERLLARRPELIAEFRFRN